MTMPHHIGVMEASTSNNEGLRKVGEAKRSPSFYSNRERGWQPDDGKSMAPPCSLRGGGAGLPPEEYSQQGGVMDASSNKVTVDLHYGFSKEDANDALNILISGFYMLKSFQSDRVRFRAAFPEVFAKGEEQMVALGSTEEEAVDATYEALDQYFDLLSKMVYMLGYELAVEMEAPFPEEPDLTSNRTVSDLDKKEVMDELERIMNTNN
jgi:hypothetical protein